jgi:hypothetical protein
MRGHSRQPTFTRLLAMDNKREHQINFLYIVVAFVAVLLIQTFLMSVEPARYCPRTAF